MSKIIAVWGSPNSGKTTFATKLAMAIYNNYKSTVIVVYTDNETPVLPVLFPNFKQEDMYSVGVPLAKTEILREDIVKQLLTIKNKPDIGFLGFKDGENRYTYPAFGEAKAKNLYTVLQTLADYIIVDCTSSLKNPLAKIAIKEADEVIRLSSPDLKSVSWYSSQMPLYSDPEFRLERQHQVLNEPDADLFMPTEEAKAHLHDVEFTIYFVRKIKQQMLDGKLTESINDKKFNKKMKAFAERVV